MRQPQLVRDFHNPSDRRYRIKAAKKQRRRRTTLIVLAVFLSALALGMAAGYMWLRSLEGKLQLEPEEVAKINKVTAAPKSDGINILLAGTDMRPGWKSSRADSIVFVRADKKQKKLYMVSIPRDTRVAIPGRGMDKINHAWAFGGAPLLIETVGDFMGMDVNYFFQVDFSRFAQAVDAMGGVEFATDFSWYDGELGVQVRQGLQRRGGKEALALVRNRHVGPGGGGDLVRVPVQQQFLKAMIAQSVQSYTDVPRVANIVASYVNTNMTMNEMLKFGREYTGGSPDPDTTVMPGRSGPINGVSYIIPDPAAKQAIIEAMEAGEPLPR